MSRRRVDTFETPIVMTDVRPRLGFCDRPCRSGTSHAGRCARAPGHAGDCNATIQPQDPSLAEAFDIESCTREGWAVRCRTCKLAYLLPHDARARYGVDTGKLAWLLLHAKDHAQ